MLSIARCCTRLAPQVAAPMNGLGAQSFYRAISNIQTTTGTGMALLRKSQTRLVQADGLSRRTGTYALRFASASAPKSQKVVGSWLLTCGGMVFVAVALGTAAYAIFYCYVRQAVKIVVDKTWGGVTRLTESGLSMVTWKFLGEKMPATEAQWIEEFGRYKQYPEYKIMNSAMSLEEFKKIWWMEYLHRMWGRLIGISFALPATFFWARGMLSPAMKRRVLILGSLIGIQGLMGWYMVKSGLEDRFDGPSDVPRVSQYRLASHLGLALLIYTGFLYNALEHLFPAKKLNVDYFGVKKVPIDMLGGLGKFRKIVHASKGLIFVTAISGAFVAGLDAGLIYNTFPKMADRWIPQDILAFSPAMKNFTENPTTVQFNHRALGIATLSLVTYMGMKSRKFALPGRGSKAVKTVVCAAYLQAILGITTLLHHVIVPIAAMHQSGSLVLLSAITWLCHELRHVKKVLK